VTPSSDPGHRYPSAETLLAEATDASGLSDFGPGDFRDGLTVLLDSLEHDSDLDPSADRRQVDALRRRLVNRLEVEAWYGDHPEIADVAVQGPIDINGLPRTGTTALANILSLDPQFRSLRGWEQGRPCPPPVAGEEANDERRNQALADHRRRTPELKAMHLFDVDATMEDTEVLGMAFHGQQYMLPVFDYHAWWRTTDMTSAYQYHRRVVRLLGSRCPPERWLFKAPHHNFHLEAIVAAYPDARFIVTHRDPAKAVPSWASIVSAILPPAAGERDLHRLGREISEHLRVGVESAMAARARLGEDRFIDVHHRDLVADPFAVVRRIYDTLGFDLQRSFEADIAAWHERNRSGTHGAHRYTAEGFGLSEDQLRSDFGPYLRHFAIEVET
jgi:hypothetical protein